MRKVLLIVAVFLLGVGCKNKDAVPSNVVPPKKMQAVLWDMMRADQFLADYVLNKDTSLKQFTESTKLYEQILAINSLSKEQFQRSFSYYTSRPLLLKSIMDSIVNAPAEIITADTAKPVIVKDSLKTGAKDSLKLLPDSSITIKKVNAMFDRKKNKLKKRKGKKKVL